MKETRLNYSFYPNLYIFNNTNITLLIEASSSPPTNRVALAFREHVVQKRGLTLTQLYRDVKRDVITHNLHKLDTILYQPLSVSADRFVE